MCIRDSYNFIHSRREVRCFLQSAADYWLTEFHFDGLRTVSYTHLDVYKRQVERLTGSLILEQRDHDVAVARLYILPDNDQIIIHRCV